MEPVFNVWNITVLIFYFMSCWLVKHIKTSLADKIRGVWIDWFSTSLPSTQSRCPKYLLTVLPINIIEGLLCFLFLKMSEYWAGWKFLHINDESNCFCGPAGTLHWRWWLGPHSCYTGWAQVNVLYGTRNQLIMFGASSKAGRYRTPAAHVHPISLSLPQRFFPCRIRSCKKMHSWEDPRGCFHLRQHTVHLACNLIPCL